MTDQKIIIPAKALKLIEGYEGLISGTPGKPEKHVRGAYERKYFPYQGAADKKGVLTIGRGHVVKKGEDFSEGLTLQEVNDLLLMTYTQELKGFINY
jgi:GH24 family phage-related lysozyme (muramidase)